MIKYYACLNTIRMVEISRETEHSVFTMTKCRENKKSDYSGYFNTWEEAKSFLLEVATRELHKARRMLQKAQDYHGNIAGMKQE